MAEATIADGDVEYAATTGADSKVTLDPPRSPLRSPLRSPRPPGPREASPSPLTLLPATADTSCAA